MQRLAVARFARDFNSRGAGLTPHRERARALACFATRLAPEIERLYSPGTNAAVDPLAERIDRLADRYAELVLRARANPHSVDAIRDVLATAAEAYLTAGANGGDREDEFADANGLALVSVVAVATVAILHPPLAISLPAELAGAVVATALGVSYGSFNFNLRAATTRGPWAYPEVLKAIVRQGVFDRMVGRFKRRVDERLRPNLANLGPNDSLEVASARLQQKFSPHLASKSPARSCYYNGVAQNFRVC